MEFDASKLPPGISEYDKVVFRVETGKGLGPYIGVYDCKIDDILNKYDLIGITKQTPCARKDIPRFKEGIHYCGFESMDAMFKWFPIECIQDLQQHGYSVNAYAVPAYGVSLGKKQLGFEKENATFLYEVPV